MPWPVTRAALFLILAPCAAGAQTSIADFAGSWRGAAVANGATESEQELNVTLRLEGDGFHLQATGWQGEPAEAGGGTLDARFIPSSRDGVYTQQLPPPSFLSRLFGTGATSNPLSGAVLLWARFSGEDLTIYRFMIDDGGGFDLDRFAWKLADSDLLLALSRRTEAMEETLLEGRLRPVAG